MDQHFLITCIQNTKLYKDKAKIFYLPKVKMTTVMKAKIHNYFICITRIEFTKIC